MRPEQDAGGTVLHVDPPRFPPTEAAEIAHRLFGISGSARPLGSERDQNFLIGDQDAEQAVLKISNHAEHAGVVDMETTAILHVARADPDLPVTRPRLLVDGDPAAGALAYRASIPASDSTETHLVRMFTYVPGQVAESSAEMASDAIWEYGAVLARLGRALRGFFHPSAGRVLLWDVQNTTALRPLMSCIQDPARRRLINRVIDRFETDVVPAWPTLRQQVIHGDFTLDNALLDERMRVSGIVDFGDMSHSALACDVSAALASILRDRDLNDVADISGAFLAGYQSVTPLEDMEHQLLPALLAARLAATVVISAWRIPQFPENEYIQGWEAGSWPLLEFLDGRDSEDVSRLLAGTPIEDSGPDLEARRRAVLGSALSPLTYERPVQIERGQGVWLFDSDGRRYLDAYNNVPVVGHCHPRVTEAIARQARTLNINVRYLHATAIELAERLVATMPPGSALDTVMLVNSGSEANDLAWRLATTFTGREGAIVTAHAYHGITAASADLSPESWPADRSPNHVETISAPDAYRRNASQGSDRDWANQSASEVKAAITRMASRNLEPAALYLDGGFTSDGILTPPAAYFQEVVRQTHTAGALFVADEVQVGHGRTGEHLWSFAAAGIAPDVVTLGKPMGNGHPVAAVITRAEIVERYAAESSFFSTFGGNQVAAAAALAVLDVIRDERLTERAAEVGGDLQARLSSLVERHHFVGDIRGRGLLIGVELVADPDTRSPDSRLADRVMNELRERGILIGRTGPYENVLKIRPPLVFGPEHVEMIAAALDDVLAAVDA